MYGLLYREGNAALNLHIIHARYAGTIMIPCQVGLTTGRFVARIQAQTIQLSDITGNYFAVNDDVEMRAKTTRRRRRRPRTGAGTDDMSRLRRWYRLFSLPPLRRPPSTTLYPLVSPLSLSLSFLLHLSMNFRPYQLILKAPLYIQFYKFNSYFNAIFFPFESSFSLNFCSHLVNSDVTLFHKINPPYFIPSSLFQEFFSSSAR